jgi:hypothetical protein
MRAHLKKLVDDGFAREKPATGEPVFEPVT